MNNPEFPGQIYQKMICDKHFKLMSKILKIDKWGFEVLSITVPVDVRFWGDFKISIVRVKKDIFDSFLWKPISQREFESTAVTFIKDIQRVESL